MLESMTNVIGIFEFTVTLHPVEDPRAVFTVDLVGRTDSEIRAKADELHPGNKVINVHCATPRWRREIGHMILSDGVVQGLRMS